MKRLPLLNIAAACLMMAAGAAHAATMIEVFKSPTCGCCTKWIEHLRANGFEVKATDVQSASVLKPCSCKCATSARHCDLVL